MRIEHSKQNNTSTSSDQTVLPEIKALQELNAQFVDSVMYATHTVPRLTRPALYIALPIEYIFLQMEKEAASGSMDELDEIRGKIPKLSELVHVLIAEFESIENARDQDEVDKIWSNLSDEASKIPAWYYRGVASH